MGTPAPDIVGVGVDGLPVTIRVTADAGRMLLAFLSTDCMGCASVWRGLDGCTAAGALEGLDAAVVLRAAGGDRSVPTTGPAGVSIAVSERAWNDYGVVAYPTVVIVDRPRAVVAAHATVFDWAGVEALLDDRR